MKFSERLKGLREDCDRTQLEVAQALKITRSTLANYEVGIREPDLDTLVKIADYFDVSVDYLLGRTSIMIMYHK